MGSIEISVAVLLLYSGVGAIVGYVLGVFVMSRQMQKMQTMMMQQMSQPIPPEVMQQFRGLGAQIVRDDGHLEEELPPSQPVQFAPHLQGLQNLADKQAAEKREAPKG